jgi:trehalose/maltose hydrolase-like predicted phosphorylase
MTAIEKRQFIEKKLSQVSESVLDEVYILLSNSEVICNLETENLVKKQSFEELLEQTSAQYEKVWEALA